MSSLPPPAPLGPGALLQQARDMAGRTDGTLGTTASRAAALLGRSALEEGIWRMFPQLKQVSGRTMLLTLPHVFDRRAARQASMVWSRLSAATHHHAYEMPPTDAELTAMLDVVAEVLEVIQQRQAARTGT